MPRQHRVTAARSMLAAAVTALLLLTTDTLAQSTTTTSSAIAATDSCPSVASGTFTFACDNACGSYQPCIAASATSGSAGCQCFTIDKALPSSYKTFNLLIPFDAATNALLKTTKLEPYEIYPGTWDLNAAPWVSNTEVTKLAPFILPALTTKVYIRGGDSLSAISKGFMAKVEIDPKFLAKQTQVTLVSLENLDLATSIDAIIPNLPSTLKYLYLGNTGLTEFPLAIKALTSLQEIIFDRSNIAQLTAVHEMPHLERLSIHGNNLKTFTAVYPKLDFLNIGGNQLANIPEAVMKHPRLTTLLVNDNWLTKFNQSNAIASLTHLVLFNNQLTSFDAHMPNLENLDLRANSFTAFPPAIFSHANLTTLLMDYNEKMRNVSFTNEQTNFLNYLAEFTISNYSLQTDCTTDQKYTLKNVSVTVCISNTKDVAIIEGPRIATTSAPSKPSSSFDSTSSASTPTPSSSSVATESSSLVAPIAGGSAAVLLLLIVVAIVVVRRRRKSAAKAEANATATGSSSATNVQVVDNNNNAIANAGEVSLWQDAKLRSIKVDTDAIRAIRKIGSGAFADVWLVKFRGAELLASKRLRESEATPEATQKFIEEIKLVATLTHPRVVELKGVAWIREVDLQALFEYMNGGDLRMYLTNPQTPVQWSAEKLQIAIDVAEALVYVHSFIPPLVHRDLKSRNVLLSHGKSSSKSSGVKRSSGGDESGSDSGGQRAKLTDFGVSRYQSEQNTMTAGKGTGRWLAPEVIAGSNDYGSAADIFSFGVVLSELDSHQVPYEDVRSANGNPLPEVALLQLVAAGELVPKMSATCPPQIAELARLCLSLDPADRPAAPQVVYVLRTLQKDQTETQEYVI